MVGYEMLAQVQRDLTAEQVLASLKPPRPHTLILHSRGKNHFLEPGTYTQIFHSIGKKLLRSDFFFAKTVCMESLGS